MHDPVSFLDLVTRMRRAQLDYFNTRNRQDVRNAAMVEAKRLEKEVDQAIAESKNGQGELF